MPKKRRCAGIKSDGTRCEAPSKLVDPKSGYCINHDPERREERLAASRRGGRATARKFHTPGIDPEELGELETAEDIGRWLRITGHSVAAGRIDHRDATAIFRAVELAMKREQTASREELAELREQLKKAKSNLRAVS